LFTDGRAGEILAEKMETSGKLHEIKTLHSYFRRRCTGRIQVISERGMSPMEALVSIGDDGVLNQTLSPDLSDIWIDRDLSWLDFNERVLAQALDERTPLLGYAPGSDGSCPRPGIRLNRRTANRRFA
jgi:hypothetical protein